MEQLDRLIWAEKRLINPIIECFSPDVAGQIANLAVDPEVQAWLEELADKLEERTETSIEGWIALRLVGFRDFFIMLRDAASAGLAVH